MFLNDFYDEEIIATLATGVSHVRFLHAAPGAPNVDIYVNNRIVARNVSYKSFTEYIQFPAGTYSIKIFQSGKRVGPIIDTNVAIPANGIATVAVIGTAPSFSIYAITEPRMEMIPGNTYVRFVHLSPTTPAVDLEFHGGKALFSDIRYKGITDYKRLKPGTYDFDIKTAAGDKTILHVPNIKLLPNRFYSIYAVGLLEGTPRLQILIPLDGISYIRR